MPPLLCLPDYSSPLFLCLPHYIPPCFSSPRLSLLVPILPCSVPRSCSSVLWYLPNNCVSFSLPPSSLSPTGILDLPDVITPSSRDVSSPPGRSSDVGEQSSKGTSEDTTLPDEDVLGNQIVLLLHMKRFHHDGARLRKVTDAVSVPPWLSLASLVGEQGAAAGIDPLRSSYGEGDIASGAKPSANMAVDHLDSAGDRDRGLQEVHGVRGARERAVVHSGTEYGQIQVMMQQRSSKRFLHWQYARLI
ncbi:uncharacterized protein LOC132451272 isoform X2 [Gadus macrocephalus]|uniref:uncharacterized protein LOC132451272 isoform X2 n=1 Tax=Gadus macrocephalus TaxID=80720 RepID=UPI0028CB337D|nr:uncharacterized protein LOC132451272 isoform X2 [Gadus macrocephalus]